MILVIVSHEVYGGSATEAMGSSLQLPYPVTAVLRGDAPWSSRFGFALTERAGKL